MKKYLLFAVSAIVVCLTSCGTENEPSVNNQNTTSIEKGDGNTQGNTKPKELYTGKDAGVNTNYQAKPFSIASNKQILFAQGNLQYKASTGTWQFAEDQYERLGHEANALISATHSGWIDMFGWGTSGYNGKYPYMTDKASDGYGNGTNDISGTNYDWGRYNPIRNGGNQKGLWRTLTLSEWEYICDTRPNAANLRGFAKVDTIKGYILLPDGYIMPDGLTLNATVTDFTTNVYTMDQWKKMEALGAVFLPVAGTRTTDMGVDGMYWLGTCGYGYNIAHELKYSNTMAWIIFFQKEKEVKASIQTLRAYGICVRLVKDVQ